MTRLLDGRLRPCHTPLNIYLQHTQNTTDANGEFCLTTLQLFISLTSCRHHCDTHNTPTCPLFHVILVTPTTLRHFHSLMSSRLLATHMTLPLVHFLMSPAILVTHTTLPCVHSLMSSAILVTHTTVPLVHSLMSSSHPGDTHDTPTCQFLDVIPPSW